MKEWEVTLKITSDDAWSSELLALAIEKRFKVGELSVEIPELPKLNWQAEGN